MARGFLSGAIAGTLVSAVGLGGASLLSDGPRSAPPEATALEVPVGSEFNRPREDGDAVLPEVSVQPAAPAAPQVAAPEPDDLAGLAAETRESAAQPQAGQAEGVLPVPETGAASSSGVAVEGDSPVLPSPRAMAPAAPVGEADVSISTDPAQPALPDISEDAAFPETDLAAIAEAPEEIAPAEPEVASPDPQPAPETEERPGEAAIAPEPTEEASPQEATDSTIGNLATGITTDRLPSLGDTAEPDAAADPEGHDTVPEAELPPLERYAAAFENPEGKPLMSIILIDDGSSPLGFQALESFPYPLSFAVDASWEGATEAMATYRAAGFEVLAMVDLPDGAGPQDAEVAMQVVFERLPEVVAVMEGTVTGLQTNRQAVGQLAPILLESGHGAVFFPKGLNTAQQLLAREGVPAVTSFRDFDASGQAATVIRRFLDQAAFKAVQEDAGVVMVGRLRPDTVSALLLWGLQDRAERVALAPISALLRGE